MKFGILLTSIYDATVDAARPAAAARGAGAHRRAARLRPHGVRPALPGLGAALLPAGPVADPHGPGRADHGRRDGHHPAVDGQPGRHRRADGHPRRADRRAGDLRRRASVTAGTSSTRSGSSPAPGWPASRSRWNWSRRCGAARRSTSTAASTACTAPSRRSPAAGGRPAVWVGGQAAGAVKRAARMGDAWYSPPFPSHAELAKLRQLFLDTRPSSGCPPTATSRCAASCSSPLAGGGHGGGARPLPGPLRDVPEVGPVAARTPRSATGRSCGRTSTSSSSWDPRPSAPPSWPACGTSSA